jgi:hypothetical protein
MLCFCFVFLRLVYPLLPVSLDYSFLIASSVFSNVYSSWNVVAFAIMLRNHRNNNVSKQTNKNNVNK